MILLLWLTGVADLALTAWGIAIDIVPEANPLMARAYDVSLVGTVVAGTVLTAAVCYFLHWAREHVPWLNPALWGLLLFRLGVLGLHAVWVVAVLRI